MTPEVLLDPNHQKARPQPEYVLIEASIEALDQEANLAWEKMNAAYEGSDEAAKLSIDQLQANYDTAVTEAAEKGEPQPSLSVFLESAQDVPEEYMAGALSYEGCFVKMEVAEAELERYAPEKAESVKQQATELEAELDYDKVVSAAFSDEDNPQPFEGIRISSINTLYDVSKVIGMSRLFTTEGSTLTYQQLQSIEHSLISYAQDWKEKGLLREDEAAHNPESESIVLSSEQITGIASHINDIYSVRTKYKKFDSEIKNKIQAVLGLTKQVQIADQAPTSLEEVLARTNVIYNEGLSAAMNRRLVQKLDELPADELEADIESETYAKLVEDARGIEVGEVLKNIEVSGSLENLPFEYSEAELKVFLFSSVPAAALASVKRIQFRPMTKEEDEQDTAFGLHQWSDELNGSEIIISDAKVRQRYQDTLELMGEHKDAETIAQLSAKNRMLQTITHEFGHALHEVLPVAALKQWEEQRATDPTNVTAYVKDRHDNNHQHRYMDDFADTMALFINQPEELVITSSVRFNAMRQIFEEYMPFYSDVTKKLQERRIATYKMVRSGNGISDEDVKKAYLSHE